jgi:hypothetical protein
VTATAQSNGLEQEQTDMSVTVEQAIEYVRKMMSTDDYGTVGELVLTHNSNREYEKGKLMRTIRMEDDTGVLGYWDVWMEDLGDGPFVYGEW